ncbi:DUF397 domain-containing protein [Streptomyces griseoluteus]|uniref:DUF397 domain-containing protein n=1 Tax=Streptomyces griseoluteus TaxID=29306 RepID=A0A4Z1D6Y8_STRGP|nr:DUF397 domain-containing protein [Streptomyces griseoluteus]TGN77509.1 DUF397 domain-containing protein [Streptomyces griseoluteus]GHF24879.1 hypothetical protein GCM10017776_49100 [Streptomyces griseoluteus]
MNKPTLPNASSLQGWRKSTYSGNEGGSCIEVLDGYPTGIPVRDSKAPQGPALIFSSTGWTSFVSAIKDGNLPA